MLILINYAPGNQSLENIMIFCQIYNECRIIKLNLDYNFILN